MDNEQIIRNAYKIAEIKDAEGWLAAFTPDGTFTDQSIGVTYRGRDRFDPVENYGRAFPDMANARSAAWCAARWSPSARWAIPASRCASTTLGVRALRAR